MEQLISIKDHKVILSVVENNKINKEINNFVIAMDGKKQSINYYSKQRNATKAADDIRLGKKAEYFIAKYMCQQFGHQMYNPDMEIRNGKHKGWFTDLSYIVNEQKINIHVKACSIITYNYCGDYSWTFQYSNKNKVFGTDSLFKTSTPNDIIALVFLTNPISHYCIIKAIIPWCVLKNKLKHPRKENLIGLKKCIYYNDLKNTNGTCLI